MKRESLPLIAGQLIKISVLISTPILVSAAGIFFFPGSNNARPSDVWLSISLLMLSVVIVGGLLISLLRRHEIILTDACLIIKHSFYTAQFDRQNIKGADITSVDNVNLLGISTKRNGIAAFGVFSGWFYAERGDICFCAITSMPVYNFRFKGALKAPLLAVSCSSEMSEAIRVWSAGGS